MNPRYGIGRLTTKYDLLEGDMYPILDHKSKSVVRYVRSEVDANLIIAALELARKIQSIENESGN